MECVLRIGQMQVIRGVVPRYSLARFGLPKGQTMKTSFLSVVALSTLSLVLPVMAFAMPAVGDIVGTDPTTATAALAAAGCPVSDFEAEDGKIEAKCTDAATGKLMEVYIDPASGAVSKIKSED